MTGVQTCALPIYCSFKDCMNDLIGVLSGEEQTKQIRSSEEMGIQLYERLHECHVFFIGAMTRRTPDPTQQPTEDNFQTPRGEPLKRKTGGQRPGSGSGRTSSTVSSATRARLEREKCQRDLELALAQQELDRQVEEEER